jgi:tRNA U34 2-thiouridine synthase MnmA/TrmU
VFFFVLCEIPISQNDIPVTSNGLNENHIEGLDKRTGKSDYAREQAAVFYSDEVCLGGGTIDTVYLNDERREY